MAKVTNNEQAGPMPDERTVVRYADVLRRQAAQNDNVADQYDALRDADTTEDAAEYRRDAAALRALADLCEQAEELETTDMPMGVKRAEARGLVAVIRAGYRDGR